MKVLVRWSLLSATLVLLACSEDDVAPGGASGAAGTAAAGAAGNAASGSSGSAAGGAAGSATGAGGAVAGTSTAGGASAGAGAATAGSAGSASAGQASGGSAGNAAGGGSAGTGGAATTEFKLISPAFEHVETCTTANRNPCNFFPSANVFTNIGGMNQSPELSWGAGPSGTSSYVVCLHDTSANATHWCLWNIPAATTHLPANLAREKMPAVPAGASQDGLGLGNSGDGYIGPGARGNVYQFRLYALSVATYTPPDAEDRRTVYAELEQDPDDIVLATSTLRGRANPQ